MVKDIAKNVAIAVISSACVGLATIAGIVLINQDNIGDLQDDLKDLETEVKEDIRILQIQLGSANGNITDELANKLIEISPEDADRIASQLQLNYSARPSSAPQTSNSEELFSKDNFSPELQEVIEYYQLTETDLKNYWYLMKSYE